MSSSHSASSHSASGVARDHFQVLIVGGGTAGITVAARLRRAGVTDIAVLEPADVHWYQPLWTLVGGGRAPLGVTRRPEATVIPRQVCWIREAATAVDPEARTVTTAAHRVIGYDHLVMAPGLQLDWDATPASTPPSDTVPYPATTLSSMPRTPGNSSVTCAQAPLSSPSRADRSNAVVPRRRSPIWPPITGAGRGSWIGSGWSLFCPPTPCSAYRSGAVPSSASPTVTGSRSG